jgi:curved DNA-binding protein
MLVDKDGAVTDAEAHESILRALYKYRRENAENLGVLAFYIKEFLKCPADIFEFHVWYLKSKGYIERTEQGTLAITVQGVDHVITLSRTSIDEQLLIAGFEGHQNGFDKS